MITFEFEGVTYKVARDVGYATTLIQLPDGRLLRVRYDGSYEPPLPVPYEVVRIETAELCEEVAGAGHLL